MPSVGFEKLEVYRLAEQVADEAWRIVQRWPPMARHTVGPQLVPGCRQHRGKHR